MKLNNFNHWLLESAETRLHQLGILPNLSAQDWLKRMIEAAHPEWTVNDGMLVRNMSLRLFVWLGLIDMADPDADFSSNDTIELEIDRFDRLQMRHGKSGKWIRVELDLPSMSRREVAQAIFDRFEKFVMSLDLEVDESFDRLQQLNLAPTGNFFELLTMLVERAHPDWHLITRNIGRQMLIMPDWTAPVEITFEVDHSFYDEPNEHITVIQPIDELHRFKLRSIELLSHRGKYSPWTEAKRALAKIEEYVERTESSAKNK